MRLEDLNLVFETCEFRPPIFYRGSLCSRIEFNFFFGTKKVDSPIDVSTHFTDSYED